MQKLKDICNGIISIIAGCGVVAVIIVWIVTFISLTFGLAIWSTQWFWGLI